MSKVRILGDEIYDYHETGDINYGEDASGWVESATEILGQFSGPGDIPLTEVTLTGTDDGTRINGTITNFSFDTAYVQSINASGFIRRDFLAAADQVEQFEVQGTFNGTELIASVTFTGDDTEFEFSIVGGQFNFSYLKLGANTDTVSIKFSASAVVDEDFFA